MIRGDLAGSLGFVSYADPAGNYAASSTTGTLSVNRATLTVTATGVNRVYDGSTGATVTLSDNRVSGDSLSESYSKTRSKRFCA